MQLFEVVKTLHCAGLLFGAGQRRQKQGGENCNDRDHDQKLDQREAYLHEVRVMVSNRSICQQ